MTIDLMFNAIADHLPDLRPIGRPERLRSSMINGIKHWQVDYGGAGTRGQSADRLHRDAAATAEHRA
jgi:cholest-4-en-3-one 26-monooxygenase